MVYNLPYFLVASSTSFIPLDQLGKDTEKGKSSSSICLTNFAPALSLSGHTINS